MTNRFLIATFIFIAIILISCSPQHTAIENAEVSDRESGTPASKKDEPHQYGGWYCPDNFGFVPVDIQELDAVPAISDRLPTQEELRDHKSLIAIDTEKYPDARALEMDLPRVARIYSDRKGMSELIIVIQAIIVSEDTVVGYRFPNGGNGSAWLSEVTFLSQAEVAEFGAQPFYYSKSVLQASKEEIWRALTRTDHFQKLGEKFDKQAFFAGEWRSDAQAHLNLESDGERATGHVGTLFGNVYLHIDYDLDGFHYSEKLLMMENQEDHSTELHLASGPYPEDFERQKSNWNEWVQAVKKVSEARE